MKKQLFGLVSMSSLLVGTAEGQCSADKNVVVVGGGIAGLTTAYWLEQEGCSVTVLEANDRLGGRIKTGVLADLGHGWTEGSGPGLYEGDYPPDYTISDLNPIYEFSMDQGIEMVETWGE